MLIGLYGLQGAALFVDFKQPLKKNMAARCRHQHSNFNVKEGFFQSMLECLVYSACICIL